MKKLMSRRRNQVIVIVLAFLILLGYYLLPRGFVVTGAQGPLSAAASCTLVQTDQQGRERSAALAGAELTAIVSYLSEAKVQYRWQGGGSAAPAYSYTLTFTNESGAAIGVALLDSQGYQYAGKNRYRILGEAAEFLPNLLSAYVDQGQGSGAKPRVPF